MKRTLAAPFYGACALLVVILPLEWLPSAEPPPVKAASLRLVAPTETGADTKDTGEWADTVLARPLFTVGRRAPKSTGSAHQATNTGLPRLAGIMITMAGKWAIFAPDGGKPLVLKEGAVLDDATVRTIQHDRVLVSGPKGDQVLLPTFDHARAGQLTPTTPVFPQPGLNPGFPNPGFNPAFNGRPNFPIQVPQQPQQPGGPGDANDDNGDAPGPPPPPQMAQPLQSPFPGQRNPTFPRE